MSAAGNLALRLALAQLGIGQTTEVFCNTAASQTGAVRANSMNIRVVGSVATGSLVLPQMLTGENGPLVNIFNDSPNSINLYPAVNTTGNATYNESINALGGNAPLAIAANQFAVCVPVDTPSPIGGGPTTNSLNWRVAVST